MKTNNLLGVLFVTGAFVLSATVATAQPAANGQQRPQGSAIARLLRQADATKEQKKEFNDTRLELRTVPNYRAALRGKLNSTASAWRSFTRRSG